MKKFKVFVVLLWVVVIGVWGAVKLVNKEPQAAYLTIDVPTYHNGSTQTYVRDGNECIAYRVWTNTPINKLSNDQLKAVFHDAAKGDSYYLHTVWFYNDSSTALSGGIYDACVEETSAGKLTVDRR